jgi:molybdopterin-guanine dinucleotide biosynthesis protein A
VRHATLTGASDLMGLVLAGRAETALAGGDLALGEEAVGRAAALANEAEDAVGRAEAGRIRALIALARGDLPRALEQALAARARAEALGSTLLQAESAAVAARALDRLGRGTEAVTLRTEAEQLFAALGAAAHLRRLFH